MVKTALLVATIALSLMIRASIVRADDSKEIVVINWIDQFTFGLPATVVGGAGAAGVAIAGKNSDTRLDHTNKQFALDDVSNGVPFAIGPFQFGSSDTKNWPASDAREESDRHESAHTVQWGMLGPQFGILYGLSSLYGLGETGSDRHNAMPAENWASAWGNYLAPSLVNNHKLDFKFGYGNRDRRAKINYALFERSSRLETFGADEEHLYNMNGYRGAIAYDGTSKDPTYPVEVNYTIGKIGATFIEHCNSSDSSVQLEAQLFDRKFLTEWKTLLPGLRIISDSKQEIGKFEIDVENRKVDSTLISHKMGYGLQIGNRKYVAVDAIGRVGYGVKGQWGGENAAGLIPFVSYGYEGDVHVADQAKAYYKVDNEVGTDGYRTRTETTGIGTPELFQFGAFTGADGKSGKPRALYGSIEYEKKSESSDPTTVKVLWFNLGGRFK